MVERSYNRATSHSKNVLSASLNKTLPSFIHISIQEYIHSFIHLFIPSLRFIFRGRVLRDSPREVPQAVQDDRGHHCQASDRNAAGGRAQDEEPAHSIATEVSRRTYIAWLEHTVSRRTYIACVSASLSVSYYVQLGRAHSVNLLLYQLILLYLKECQFFYKF